MGMNADGTFQPVTEEEAEAFDFYMGAPGTKPAPALRAIFRKGEEFLLKGHVFYVADIGTRALRIRPKLEKCGRVIRGTSPDEAEIADLREQVRRLKEKP